LLKNDDYSEGMGHNSVIKTNEKYYIVYHGRDYGLNNPNYDTRTARIAELIFNKDKITVKKFG
jgi:GH43 family beta-xylosidase